MSYHFGRNLVNFSTLNSALFNYVEIQSNGVGLVVYSNDPTNPFFSIDTQSANITIDGEITVTGTATFDDIVVNSFNSPLQKLADANPSDVKDIGLYGEYNDGTIKYSGIIRDTSDTGKRWVFFQ
jgi:hypothetical protein